LVGLFGGQKINLEVVMGMGSPLSRDEQESPPIKEFGWALKQMRNKFRVTRSGWNGSGQFLFIQEPNDKSKMTLPYIYITTVQRTLVPWVASQTDLLATDWQVMLEPDPNSAQQA